MNYTKKRKKKKKKVEFTFHAIFTQKLLIRFTNNEEKNCK